MTNKEIVEMLKLLKEQAVKSCNDTAIIDVKKGSFDFVMDSAITALSQEQQSEWERDHEILKAYADGQESVKPCKDAISRQAAIDAVEFGITHAIRINRYTGEKDDLFQASNDELEKAIERIKDLPPVSVAEKVGRCKDCKYFEYDSVANVDGIPLIVAHEICSKWGDGCKTIENGYCFLYEPQESEK